MAGSDSPDSDINTGWDLSRVKRVDRRFCRRDFSPDAFRSVRGDLRQRHRD
ncbi:hypothetical protein LG3211_1395 [Lysobacter gummosus]|nr:hypothetical protein LG3211_1395 [Lysobacter gummosus]